MSMIRNLRPGLLPNCFGLVKCPSIPPFTSMTRREAMSSGPVVIST